MADDTWSSVALSILERIAEVQDEGILLQSHSLAADLKLDAGRVATELRALVEGGYIAGDLGPKGYAGGGFEITNPRLTGTGLRTVGAWPSNDPYEAFIEILDRYLSDPDLDDATRSKVEKVRTAVGNLGKGVGTGLLANFLTAGIPGL